jgi:D-sedoheptulose 7-phosphate isomerase
MLNKTKIKNNFFFKNYFKKINALLYSNKQNHIIQNLINITNKILLTKKKNKILIIGNGGSASIASHFSIDICKNTNLVCQCFNESSLITCLANDFGYKNWVKKAIQYYGNEGDVLIAISSSGNSENILNACFEARKKNFSSIVTFSGFSSRNKLKKLGDINMWVNSKVYNIVENIHQIWLLSIIDYIMQKPKNKI